MSQTSVTYTWTYDQVGTGYANGVGRLTSTNTPVSSTQYTYDPQGRLLTDIQRIKAATGANASQVTRTVTYTYDDAGDVTSILYPSGRKLTDTYSGVTSASVSGPCGAYPQCHGLPRRDAASLHVKRRFASRCEDCPASPARTCLVAQVARVSATALRASGEHTSTALGASVHRSPPMVDADGLRSGGPCYQTTFLAASRLSTVDALVTDIGHDE